MDYFEPKKIKVKPLCDDTIHNYHHHHNQQRLQRGCTNLMYACQQGLTDSVVSELRNKPNIVHRRDRSNKSALHYCTGQKDLVAAASVAVAAPELLESADEDGFTPLHLAVIQGNMSVVNLLLANKADVNALDHEGHSVVHWATVCGEVEALRAVLQAGANVSNPDINGGSPLHYAAQMCGANYEGKSNQASSKLALEILEILLSHHGSSVNVADKDGRQPLLWAASAGSAKAILSLVKAGARIESSDKDGLTALHCAASRGHTECLDTLINLCGAQTDLIDLNGCTALHYAVTLGHADATSLLLNLDADPNRQDRKGRTPAHCGCAKGQLETVKILGAKNANLWLRNAKGDLPVHEAAAAGRKELVLWLLEQRPNQINVSSNDGRTLLHLAASNENTDLCKMLLDLGADVNSIARVSHNVIQTPLDCALQKGHRSVAKYLQSIGGLPASKIRLSARRQINTTEPVKPLKFTEKEEIVDLKTNTKRYVVYVKKSDSEESLCNNASETRSRDKSSRKLHCKCRHHRRTASSCSDSYKPKFDEFSDEERNRSKSSMEVSRRSKHRYKYTSSSGSSSADECNCCARSPRRSRHHQKIKRSKSYDKDKFNSDKKTGKSRKYEHTPSKTRHRHRRSRSASSDHTDGGGLSDFDKIKAKFEAYKKKLEILEEHKKSLVLMRSTTQSVEKSVPVQNVESIPEVKQKIIEEVDKPKPPSRPASGKKRPQSARASSANRRKLLQSQETRDNIPESEIMPPDAVDVKAELKDAQELSNGTNGNETHQVVTEAQVHVNAEATNKEEEKQQESAEKIDNKIELEVTPDTKIIAVEPAVESIAQQPELSPSVEITEPTAQTELKPTPMEIAPELESSAVQPETSVTKQDQTDNADEKAEPSFAVIPCDAAADESSDLVVDRAPNQSFMLIESDNQLEDLPAVTALPDETDEEIKKSSFQVLEEHSQVEMDSEYITDSTDKEKSLENLAARDDTGVTDGTEEADETEDTITVQEKPASSFTIIEDDIGDSGPGLQAAFVDSNDNIVDDKIAIQQIETINVDRTSGSGLSRRKKLKKRLKSKTLSANTDDEPDDGTLEQESIQQISKDQDSGFEPSPRASKPSRRLAFTTLEDGEFVPITPTNRAVGRKPGDRDAVNMVTVQQSIQRNIRRYYMERKIFQHLLELKSLQIRSSKSNESMLVKRAVDDYHKSIISLGYEIGSTLKRYPYQDFTFKNFETFLYETLKNLQKNGTYNFQNISEVYKEAERRLSPEYTSRYERALNCTTKTHRCLHAVHAYTGIPCAAYIPMMNHHTIPKFGFGSYKSTNGVGSFYLPKILTKNPKMGNKVSLELSHGNHKQLIPLPYDKLDKNKKYYVTFSVKGNGNLNTFETDKLTSQSESENK